MLETSVAIWFLLLVVYHIIRRWMLIQRRRLAFERARHRRAEILAQRARGEDEPPHQTSTEGVTDVDEAEVDLDAISVQSLRLVRSILMLIALLSVIVLWSEIHSAFGFLENITLWDVTSTVQGVESLEPITLGAVLIAIPGVYHHHAAGAQPPRRCWSWRCCSTLNSRQCTGMPLPPLPNIC